MADKVQVAVIGAGVVGLAVARAFARAGREVVVLEREALIGSGTSSRNSEVIHAGLYYKPGSLKARTCVRGKELLYELCRTHGVPYSRCGKLLVATNEAQLPMLDDVCGRAAANGVGGMRRLSADDARALEPEVRWVLFRAAPCRAALSQASAWASHVAHYSCPRAIECQPSRSFLFHDFS